MKAPTLSIIPKNVDTQNRDEIVERLKRMLVQAENGEIENIVISWSNPDTRNWWNWKSRGMNFPVMVGYLELTIFEWKMEYLKRSELIEPGQ